MSRIQSSSITAIVAAGLGGEIGVRNRLPWRLKSDLRFFKQTTLNNVVIMGRKTYESIGGCLKDRENIVLSHRASLFEDRPGCQHAQSVAETLFVREKFLRKKAFVIGGALTYAEFAPFVDRYLFTVVNSFFRDADAFFAEGILGDHSDWEMRPIEIERLSLPNADEYEFHVVELRHRHPEKIALARSIAIAEYAARNHFLERKRVRREAHQGMKLEQVLRLA